MARYPVPLFNAIFALLVLVSVASATGPTMHPIYVWDDFVSITLMPFEEIIGDHGGTDLRHQIVSGLKKKAVFDYIFYCPEGAESETLSARAFARRNDRPWPVRQYWQTLRTQYVVFGSYSKTPDQVSVEVFLYRVKDDKMLIYRRYRVPSDDIEQLAEKVVSSIEEELLKSEPHIKRRQDPDRQQGQPRTPIEGDWGDLRGSMGTSFNI
jgi:TolB-like protein